MVLACMTTSFAQAGVVCTLLTDAGSGRVLVQQGDCARRNSPASTFKIAIALMGYDAGLLRDAHNPAWPYRPEYPAWRENWKQTTDPTLWLANSVVWYSRLITQDLGRARFQAYVDRLGYGNRDLSGDPGKDNGLTNAWLSSSLQISPEEEVAFVRKLLNRRLPVSARAMTMTETIIPTAALADGWTAHGKTGAGDLPGSGRQFGWYVGWVENGDRKVVFARLIKDDVKRDGPAGFRARDGLLADLPGLLRPSAASR